jgi:hypothetical protein
MKSSTLLPAFAALLLFSQSSCQKKQPADVLPEPKFVSVYAKLTTATVTARPVPPDSLGSANLVDSILALEGVTREQFNATVHWYDEDVQRWKPFFDEVVLALEDSVRKQQKPQQ